MWYVAVALFPLFCCFVVLLLLTRLIISITCPHARGALGLLACLLACLHACMPAMPFLYPPTFAFASASALPCMCRRCHVTITITIILSHLISSHLIITMARQSSLAS